MTKSVVVIGAGINGAATSLWLLRAGHQVTLLDPNPPGTGASYGNAGLLAQWSVLPQNTPELWKDLPKLLLSSNSALFAKWKDMPSQMPWLMRFLANATPKQTDHAFSALTYLLTDAADQHKSLAQNTPARAAIHASDLAYLYKSKEGFDADAKSWAAKQKAGFVPELVMGPDVQDYDPLISSKYSCLAIIKNQGHIDQPGTYVANLVAAFCAQGGQFLQTAAQDIGTEKGQHTVHTTNGPITCDAVVITAGIYSKQMMEKLGLSIPMQAERGYHVIYKNASHLPRTPMMMAGKFGVTPMGNDLRVAGTVELGKITSRASNAPVEYLKSYIKDAFPTLSSQTTEEWIGYRPTPSDSLPLIGRLNRSGIYTCFGHQHIGLTGGAKSGRIVADLISGKTPNADLSAFDPNRFS